MNTNRIMLSSMILAGLTLAGVPSARADEQAARRITVLSSQALCNNGDSATFYFRPGTGANRSKYLVVLSGGGYCAGDLSCSARWNDNDGDQDDVIGWHGNMVPHTAPLTFTGRGILDFGTSTAPTPNPFAGYTRIYVPYCSSDTWVGQGTTTSVVQMQDVDGDGVLDNLFPTVDGDTLTVTNGRINLYFGGAKIIAGVIDMILQGYGGDPGTIPTEIVLAGSSAGGAGVNNNLDLVANQVAQATNAARSAVVYGVSDSSNELGIFAGNVPSATVADSLRRRYEYYSGGPGSTIEVALNGHCLGHETGDPQICQYTPYVLANHIQTPIFLVGNAYDQVDHKYIFEDLTCLTDPTSSTFVAGCYDDAEAGAWIRDRISNVGAPQLASGQSTGLSGYYIPNFATPYHEVTKRTSTFFGSASTSSQAVDPHFGAGPRLNSDAGDTRSTATTLACFRDKVVYANPTLNCQHEVRSSLIVPPPPP